MRKARNFTLALVAVTATAVLAPAATHKANFTLAVAAQIHGTQLKAGSYTARWEGEGSAAEVSILQGKKTLATANATLKALNSKASQTAVTLDGADGVTQKIEAIEFEGKTTALDFSGAGSAGSSGGEMR